ncbi:MAG TPA: DUF4093 domain-containing protein [Clostridiales bacterium]|nr:DUF4093 domain-containing protein [Clostridiales bacterium]
MTRPRIAQAIIVEGKYDKIKLESIVDALILPTNGFRIFKDKEMRALIKRLAQETGLVVLTDSDKAGFVIRRHLMGLVPASQITHVYIPDCLGKESRKAKPSKEGKLGVEGMEPRILLDALARAGLLEDTPNPREPITKMDLYEAGLSGREQSRALRQKLLEHLGLPARLSAGALPDVLSRLMSREELFSLCLRLQEDCNPRQKPL